MRPPAAGILVVNDVATAIEIDGSRVVARPRDGLTAYRVPAAPHVRSLAPGLGFDRWAASAVSFQVWPRSAAPRGHYQVVLALPQGLAARRVTFDSAGSQERTIRLHPGGRTSIRIPVRGYPVPVLQIRTDAADYVGGGTPNARFLAVRIPSLSYVAERTKRDSRSCTGLPIARSSDCHA